LRGPVLDSRFILQDEVLIMRKVRIRLSSVKDVQRFVSTLASLQGDFELISGQFVLEARSLMGILWLDLTKPVCLKIYDDSPKNLAAIKPYRVDDEEDDYEQ